MLLRIYELPLVDSLPALWRDAPCLSKRRQTKIL